jgi:pimeloyl-ACP methyl ester carboxylesterase
MAPVPVVLVHGFLATPTLMLPLRRRLERADRPVRTVALAPLAVQEVRGLARQLDANVERVRRELGAERVDVVGVSLGGVLALWWAHHLDGWPRVRRLVTVGSPVRGTWAAAAGLPVLGLVSRGIWQLLPAAALVTELGRPLPPDADVTTVSLAGDLVCPPSRCRLDGATNVIFPMPRTPITHQWLVLSRRVAREVGRVLDHPREAGRPG